jgi:hypothetical protein
VRGDQREKQVPFDYAQGRLSTSQIHSLREWIAPLRMTSLVGLRCVESHPFAKSAKRVGHPAPCRRKKSHLICVESYLTRQYWKENSTMERDTDPGDAMIHAEVSCLRGPES